MTTLGTRFRNSVTPGLLNRLGESAVLLTTPEPDSGADPWTPAPEPVEVAVQVAPSEIKEMRRDGTIVRSTDWTGIMTANIAAVPQEDDSLTVGGTTYKIIYVEPIRAQGITAAYEIAARK